MKEFVIGLVKLVLATIVSLFVLSFGTLYSIGHAIVLSYQLRNIKVLPKLLWRFIDGTFAAAGHLLGEAAYTQDLLWNVWSGEAFEDYLTTEEETLFGIKNISISSATGDLEIRGKVIDGRERFSKTLNVAFFEDEHAIDAYLFDIAKQELKNKLREESYLENIG